MVLGFFNIVLSILAVIGIMTVWNWYWHQKYQATTCPDEIHFATTADGWVIALSRYTPKNPKPDSMPILCCHGLGTNGLIFDLAPNQSFARGLAAAGFDTWVVELRGHGRSERGSIFSLKRPIRWDLDTFVQEDLPAAISYVRRKTKAAKIHYVGLSMGGIIGYLLMGATGEDTLGTSAGTAIASAAILGAGLDYSGTKSWYMPVGKLKFLAPMVPVVQTSPLVRATIPFIGRFHTPFERFMVQPQNMDPTAYRRLAASGYEPMSTNLLLQLSTLLEAGGLRSADSGRRRYVELLPHIKVPILTLAGSHDHQCPPRAVARTHKLLGSKSKRMITLGRDSGHRADFGHADLVCGIHSVKEVVPLIVEWFENHQQKIKTPEESGVNSQSTKAG